MYGIEFDRVFKNKYNYVFILFIISLTLYFNSSNISEFKYFLDNKKTFLLSEKNKVENYSSYDLYGGFGFRVLYEPSALIIFFGSSSSMQLMESNVDTKEIIRIYNVYKGRKIFKKGEYKDFGGTIFLFGSLYMLFAGLASLKSDFFSRYLKNRITIIELIIIRFFFLILIFISIYIVNYLYALLNGIHFSPIETKAFFLYCLYSLIYFSFFYLIGIAVFLLFKSKKIIKLLIICFIFLFVPPETSKVHVSNISKIIPTNESLDKDKIETLMKFEKDTQKKINKLAEENKDIKVIRRALKECAKSYLKNGYILNKKREREFNDIVLKIIEHNEKGSVIFPTIYHNFLTSEISSMGYYGHKEFVKYLIKIRDDFMKFYFHKRYESGDKKIESFVKSDENIFKAQPYIPENYWIGVLFTAGYTIIIFIIIYLILLYRKKKQPKAELPDFQFHKGNTYFILRKKENEREALFNTYKAMGNTACIDRFTRDDIDVGIKPASQFTYFCKFRGNDINYALETLRTLGIGNIYTMKRKEITGEIMKKIYAAAVLDQNAEIIVLNDFIKNESKDFEEQFRKLLKHMEKQEKIILYLSSEFYEARLQQEAQKDKIPDKKIVRIDLDTVSLR